MSSPLSLQLGPSSAPEQSQPPLEPQQLQPPPPVLSQLLDNPGKRPNVYDTSGSSPPSSPPTRRRRHNPAAPPDRTRNRRRAAKELDIVRIEPPPPTPTFPWATDLPGHIHPIAYLVDNGLHSVEGQVKCSGCGRSERVVHDVRAKFHEIFTFINTHLDVLNDRAPKGWMKPPAYRSCSDCGKGMNPVGLEKISGGEQQINWLFLFLGQRLGLCCLDQLKWYCKQHNIHRSGARDRVLYLSYVSICSQLRPDIPLFQQLLLPYVDKN